MVMPFDGARQAVTLFQPSCGLLLGHSCLGGLAQQLGHCVTAMYVPSLEQRLKQHHRYGSQALSLAMLRLVANRQRALAAIARRADGARRSK